MAPELETKLRRYAELQGIDTTEVRWLARTVVHATQWFYLPKKNDSSQCKLARRSAKALISAIGKNRAAPDWFDRALRCAESHT